MRPEGGLVDTHCHLMLDGYREDFPEVLARATDAGVERMILPGIDWETSRRAVELADENPRLSAAVGVHPHHATRWSPGAQDKLRSLAASPSVVAVGEIGLDFYRDHAPRSDQLEAFLGQLDLARTLELPVIVHVRESAEEILKAITRWSQDLPAKLAGRAGVLHAFSGSAAQGQRAFEAGFFLGVAGPITYKNADRRRQITKQLPTQSLLLETDAPYMAPHPHRGERNEPAHVRLIAERLAELLDRSMVHIATLTTANARTLFDGNDGT